MAVNSLPYQLCRRPGAVVAEARGGHFALICWYIFVKRFRLETVKFSHIEKKGIYGA
jgi:hypothetical protein